MQANALDSETLFAAVRERLSCLIPRFGVERETRRILTAYDLICGESLSFDARRRPPEFSRINADGTPIQLALSLAGVHSSPLQFLAEASDPGSTMEDRRAISLDRMRAIAELFGASHELGGITDLLNHLAPKGHSALEANRSGVYWIGVSFQPDAAPALTIYVNSRWGIDKTQWQRIGRFAEFFGVSETWRSIEWQLSRRMTPLGAAITIEAGRRVSGRVYASAYGALLDYYRELFAEFHADAVNEFATAMLGDERRYPIRSTVCSFEFSASSGVVGAKFELCAHCAFANDADAAAKFSAWLETGRADAALYLETINILTRGARLGKAKLPDVHAYVGIGVRRGHTYSSVYLNPGPPLRDD